LNGGGVLIGITLAILLSRVLKSFLYEVQPGDPLTVIFVGALFVGVGLLACWGSGAACNQDRSAGSAPV
jgi:putative ABC transport system permease protein